MNTTVEQLVGHTKQYLLGSAKHLRNLPKIRSFGEAAQFATEAKDRSMAYAKKAYTVLQKGVAQCKAQYGDWADWGNWIKNKKGAWVKAGTKAQGAAKKRAAAKHVRKANLIRTASKKVEEQGRSTLT